MDGKHVGIKCPAKSGSNFFNYKNFFSIVLFAIVDADYKFIYIDVGKNGRISDGGIFANTPIYNKLENGSLQLPDDESLRDRVKNIPFLLVGDEAFPLKSYLMKPYPNRNLDLTQRIFNYRLSRVRRIVENVFGIVVLVSSRNLYLWSQKRLKKLLWQLVCSIISYAVNPPQEIFIPHKSLLTEKLMEQLLKQIGGKWRGIMDYQTYNNKEATSQQRRPEKSVMSYVISLTLTDRFRGSGMLYNN